MVLYIASDDEFTDVADSIRTKGGTQESLEWPDGFVTAINTLPDRFTKLATANLGTISTTSTSATNTNITLQVSDFDSYDMLVAIGYVTSRTNGRHVATIRLINLSATSTINTKTGVSISSSTQHYKLTTTGTLVENSGTTPYGVYVNTASIYTSPSRYILLTIYKRYNSTSSGTVNGEYVMDVYGVKLLDLF